jgi:hypothetical protein
MFTRLYGDDFRHARNASREGAVHVSKPSRSALVADEPAG